MCVKYMVPYENKILEKMYYKHVVIWTLCFWFHLKSNVCVIETPYDVVPKTIGVVIEGYGTVDGAVESVVGRVIAKVFAAAKVLARPANGLHVVDRIGVEYDGVVEMRRNNVRLQTNQIKRKVYNHKRRKYKDDI